MIASSDDLRWWRILPAFLLAPMAAAWVMGATMPLYEGLPDVGDRISRTANFVAVVVAYPSALLFGVPLFVWLRRRGTRPTLLNCTLAGAGVALLPWLLISLLALKFIPTLVLIALYGAVGGMVFWMVGCATWRRSGRPSEALPEDMLPFLDEAKRDAPPAGDGM
jgi:hypothetical protein